MFRHTVTRCLTASTPVNVQRSVNKLFYYKCENALQIRNLQTTIITSNQMRPVNKNHNTENTKVLSEKEFLLRLKNDPDAFGSDLGKEEILDEGDKREEEYFENQPLATQKLSTKQYADTIKALIRKRKLKEAIDVLETKMIKEDRVKPEAYIYNLLLGACGRVGYTKKAFSLYNRMKQRGLSAIGGTYTALFNACSNSPWPEDGLSRAKHLRNIMIEKGHEANAMTYNAMIKAFGRCGDTKTAFEIVDEMIDKRILIQTDTMNFLLQTCITDKDAGFRHALLVWRKFTERNLQPDVYSYNLLLRCVRDCGLGNVDTTMDVINRIVGNDKFLITDGTEKPNPVDTENVERKQLIKRSEIQPTQQVSTTVQANRPNLISRQPYIGNIISISEIIKPEDRLILVGGLTGFLDEMKSNNCPPDIKTFTLLLDSIPNTLAAEEELLETMKKLNVKTDIDFFNMLIKKRSLRGEYANAKNTLQLLKQGKRRPDLITYGVLALSCTTKQEALELINEMREAHYRLNAPILGTMLNQACYRISFPYVLEIMELCISEDVKPNKKFMNCLEDFRRKCKDISNDKNDKLSRSVTFMNGFRNFRRRYQTWLKEITIDDTEDEHPWHQYRINNENDAKYYKDVETHFKPRHKSLFRQKTTVVQNKPQKKNRNLKVRENTE